MHTFRRYQLAVLLVLVLIDLPLLFLGYRSADMSYTEAKYRAEMLTQNVAISIDRNLTSAFDKIDVVLGTVVDELERELATGKVNQEQIGWLLRSQLAKVPELEALRVANAQGDVVFGTGALKSGASWADRDFFALHRSDSQSGLVVSKPFLGKVSGKLALSLSRRYTLPNGEFAGVVAAPITLNTLTEILAHYQLGKHATVVLRDSDSGLITRSPYLDGKVGQVGDTTVSKELGQIIASGVPEQTYQTANSADGFSRLVTFRRIAQGGLLLIVAVASEDYLAEWQSELIKTLLFSGSFVLLSLVAAAFLLKVLRNAQEKEATEKQHALLEARQRDNLLHLNRIAASGHLPLEEQFAKALTICSNHLGLEFGIVSHVSGSEYKIVAQVSPPGTLSDGQVFDFGDTYCHITIARQRVYAVTHMGQGEEKDHPCYQAFKLETYIGAPIWVEGVIFGTVNFSSPTPYNRDFGGDDIEFVDLLARWVGSAIERDRINKRIAHSEFYLRSIIENEPECVKVLDRSGKVTQMNASGLTILEATSEADIVGKDVRQFVAAEHQAAFGALSESVLNGHAGTLEFEIIGLKGTRRWLDTHAVPMRNPEGEITGVLAVTRDVTERRRYEMNLAQAKEAAEQASRAKGEFLANMSHEIRTPMNGIIGMTSLLLDSDLNDTQAHYAKVISSSANSLLGILNDILDYSKVEAGRLEVEHIDFNLHTLLTELTDLTTLRASEKSLVFTCCMAADVPVWVKGDPNRIRQILNNFLGNALKFTVDGEIVLNVEVLVGALGGAVRFTVTDTGVGIPQEIQAKLFTPFQQADSSTTRKFGGTGLGLVISKQLAELMGGQVGMQSTEMKGSCFWVALPLVSCDAPASTEDLPAESVAIGAGIDRSRVRVLLVEDNPTNQLVAISLLRKFGYQHIEVANNGAEGVEKASQAAFDVILMDCQMPVLDGYEATTKLREQGVVTPVVAMTANVMRGDREKCLAAGMNDYIGKPFSVQEFQEALVRWTQEGGGASVEKQTAPDAKPLATVFDRQSALDRLGGDVDLLLVILESAEVDIQQALADLEVCFAEADMADVQRLLHTVKSVAANVGADCVRQVAAELEQCARNHDFEAIRKNKFALQATFQAFLDFPKN